MTVYLGDFINTKTVRIPINTYNSSGASQTITDLAVGDVKVHKDGNVAERASTSGYAVAIDFDGVTGNHLISLDLSDNDDVGFYSAGSEFTVRIEGTTVDAKTINAWIGAFSIENRSVQQVIDKLPTNYIGGSSDQADYNHWSFNAKIAEMDLDVAETVISVALMINSNRGALPTAAEITPGTISISRKAKGAAGWTAIVTDQPCSEVDGFVYYNETFNTGSGYVGGDSIWIIFKGQVVTINGVPYEISDNTGIYMYTSIRETMVDSNVIQVDGTAQRATDLAEMVQYIFANSLTLTDVIADNSVFAQLMASSGTISSFSAVTDALESIRDAITAANPQSHSAIANNETTGTLDSGTYANTVTVDNVYYQTSPVTPAVGGFGLNVDLTINIGVGRTPAQATVTGYFSAGAQRTVQVWFYDYIAAIYVQVSNSQTDFGNTIANRTYAYSLTSNMVQLSDGEVKIRFTSESTTVGDDWYCDFITLTSFEIAGAGLTADSIQAAVWARTDSGHDEDTLGYNVSKMHLVHGDIVSATNANQFIIDSGGSVNDMYNGMSITLEDKTDDHYETRRIIGYIGATKEVFVDRNFSFTPVADDDFYIMNGAYGNVNTTEVSGTVQTANDIGADVNDILEDTGTTIPNQITGLNDVSPAEVETACDASLVTYDGPTRGEATSDKNEIIVEVDANETKIDLLQTDSTAILEDTGTTIPNQITGLNDVSPAEVETACDASLVTYDGPTRGEATSDKNEIIVEVDANETKIDLLQTDSTAILEDTGTTIPNQITGLNDVSPAEVETACDASLVSYDPPTRGEATSDKDEILADHTAMKGATFSTGTDSQEAIRNRGDVAWLTGAGGASGAGLPNLLQTAVIATLASQTDFTIDVGSPDNDAYNNQLIIVTDAIDTTKKAVGKILNYVGASKTISLYSDPGIFTMAIGDSVSIVAVNDRISLVDVTTQNTDVTALAVTVNTLLDYASGRWHIDEVTSQLIFYKPDNITEVARFDLTDRNGDPSVDSNEVYDRTKV